MPSDYVREWEAVAKARKSAFFRGITAFLSPLGFRRYGDVYRRPSGRDVQLIAFHNYRGGYRLEAAVYYPELDDHRVWPPGVERKPGSVPIAHQCDVHLFLTGYRDEPDIESFDPDAVEARCDHLARVVLPWLELASSPEYRFKTSGYDGWARLNERFAAMWRARLEESQSGERSGTD